MENLFKGLQKVLQVPHAPTLIMPDNKPLLIHKAADYFNDDKRKLILKALRDLVKLPNNYYEELYLKTLYKFAEFVQALPETRYGPYSCHGGMLDHGLDRTLLALSLLRQHSITFKKDEGEQKQAIWIYVVFTIALLRDIGILVEKFTVTLCNREGTAIQPWFPYTGSMLNLASHYRYTFEKDNRPRIRRGATLLLIRQILPETGFNWLASDKEVFEAWLAMLDEDARYIGALASLIPLAEAYTFLKQLDPQWLAKETGLLGPWLNQDGDTDFTRMELKEQLTPHHLPLEQAEELAAGIAFLKWLREGLQSSDPKQRISVNLPTSNVHIVNEGVLLLPEIFMEFAKDKRNPLFRDWKTIYTQFSRLGLQGGLIGSEQAYRYLADKNKLIKGLVIENPFYLYSSPNHKAIPSANKQLLLKTNPIPYPSLDVPAEKYIPIPQVKQPN